MVPLHSTAIKRNEKDLYTAIHMPRIYCQETGIQNSLISMPYKEEKHEDVYIFASIFTKKQWKIETKTSKNGYLYKER